MRTVDKILDLVFPRRCPVCHEITADRGQLICTECRKIFTYVTDPYCIKCGKQLRNSEKLICKGCENGKMYFEQGRSTFIYDEAMRKSIYRYKYGNRPEYARYYSEEIFLRLEGKIKEWKPDVIVPIPLHKSKLQKRGYNQSYLLAKELSVLTGIPVDNQILLRTKETEKQKNLGASERALNLKNAFKINPNGVQYLSAMLIDDIYTTGATMNSAAKVLREGGISRIYCVTLSIGCDV